MIDKFLGKRQYKIIKYGIPFIFALFLYYCITYTLTDMITYSNDAADIWKTITTFHTSDIYGSYVLYKGINAVYPYVWLYDLANWLGVNEWFFIKLFYALSFSYISAIGFPSIIERLTGSTAYCFRRLLTICIFVSLWNYSKIFYGMMIDLPCLLYFILLVNVALAVYRNKRNILLYIGAGLLCGLCMSASGQYSMPAICIFIFICWITVKACISKRYKTVNLRQLSLWLLCLFICTFLVIGMNNYFEHKVVNPLREQGAWIPDGNDWLSVGLTRFMDTYRQQGSYSITIPSGRRLAIFKDYLGDTFESLEPVIYGGGYYLTIPEYLKIFLQYPADFILCYLNSFFLILSPDGGAFYFWPLFLFYSLLYLALYIGIKRCRKWKNLFSPLFWIGFSFLWAIVPLLVMNIEARTCIQIQGLIVALAVCDDTLWNQIKKIYYRMKSPQGRLNLSGNIPYPMIGWLVFICFCFLHISTLYENIDGTAAETLINFSLNFLKGK